MLKLRSQTRPYRRRAPTPLLDGIKRQDWRARPEAARALGAAVAERGEVAYWVGPSEPEPTPKWRGEQRGDARERMRLRSAKLLDAAYRFVCECRICDRSFNGLRLALARNIRLPPRMAVHIDETGEVRRVQVMWRRGLVMGVRLRERAPHDALRLSDRFALRERYYGVHN